MTSPFVEDLLRQMTLAEKAGQMTQVTLDTVSVGKPYAVTDPLQLDRDKLDEIVGQDLVGSILNVGTHAHTPERWRELIGEIQSAAAGTRLGIPVLYGIDTIHGANYVRNSTLYPQQLGLACTGNPQLVEELFRLAGKETLLAGIPWLFSPVGDVGRDPRWPRLWESFGEDVHLATELTAAATRGIESVTGAASCLKHFIGYGYPQSGMDRTPAWIPERQLREYYLPPFVAGIAEGAQTIMVNSGELNGIPVHADQKLLTDLLRNELKFEGVVVTDWEDVLYLHTRHRVADSYRTAVKMAIEAGIDMSMTAMDTDFARHVVDLVESGELTESRIDASVRRILLLKEKLGLFAPAKPGRAIKVDFPAHEKLAQTAAEESVLLLRNDPVDGMEQPLLPLTNSQRLLVVGPTANSKRSLHGGWTYTWQGEKTDALDPARHPHLLEAVRAEFGRENVDFFQGCDHEGQLELSGLDEKIASADTVLLCLGESSYTEFFGSIDDLYLPPEQETLARRILESGKPVVLLLLEGRPRCISRFADDIPAVVAAFYPGHGGARALAGVLSGRVNPSARLPVTYPRFPNGLIPYDHKGTENQELQGARSAFDPEFEFGHGLSYSTFDYGELILSKTEISQEEDFEVAMSVTNSSDRAGKHLVQLYTRTHYASVTPSVRRLRKFQLIELAAGASVQIMFSLHARDLAFVGRDLKSVTEKGRYTVMIGDQTADFTVH